MAGVVVLLNCKRRPLPSLAREQVCRQAYFTARHRGAFDREARQIESEAGLLLDAGEPSEVVFERAESLAREIVAQRVAHEASQ